MQLTAILPVISSLCIECLHSAMNRPPSVPAARVPWKAALVLLAGALQHGYHAPQAMRDRGKQVAAHKKRKYDMMRE